MVEQPKNLAAWAELDRQQQATIAALEAANERQAADIAEFMRRLGPRWFLEQNWFPQSVEAHDGL